MHGKAGFETRNILCLSNLICDLKSGDFVGNFLHLRCQPPPILLRHFDSMPSSNKSFNIPVTHWKTVLSIASIYFPLLKEDQRSFLKTN